MGALRVFCCAASVLALSLSFSVAAPPDEGKEGPGRNVPPDPPGARLGPAASPLPRPVPPGNQAGGFKPHAPTPIPDDPPPHEGALIDLPYVVEPPDHLRIDFLEALPGRPITGDLLVRPDGTISLGFYGDIYVRGLTLRQIKMKLILHMRKFLNDDTLGLTGVQFSPAENAAPEDAPESQDEPRAGAPPATDAGDRPLTPPGPASRQAPQGRGRSTKPTAPKADATEDSREDQQALGEAFKELPISIGNDAVGPVIRVHPADSDRVFVDVAAYNSKYYYVAGDVAVPGKFPSTGRDTVLDAIQYAGGFLPTADQKTIRLVRPARGGKPTKVYNIDYAAILEKGDATANLQLFPGDRLIIGRDDVVKKTVAIDRLWAPLQQVVNGLSQYALMRRGLDTAAPGLTPAQREAVLKSWVEFWSKAIEHPDDVTLDAKTFREALERALTPPDGKGDRPDPKSP